MSFTTYATAIAGSVLTAAFWNQQVRDNGNVLKAQLDDSGHPILAVRVESGAYTLAATDDFVIVDAAATIDLPAVPVDGKPYTVKSSNVDVVVDGNGNTIDGDATLELGPYDAANFVWSDDLGEWSVF